MSVCVFWWISFYPRVLIGIYHSVTSQTNWLLPMNTLSSLVATRYTAHSLYGFLSIKDQISVGRLQIPELMGYRHIY